MRMQQMKKIINDDLDIVIIVDEFKMNDRTYYNYFYF